MLRLRDAFRGIWREPRLPLTMAVVLSLAFGAASAAFTIVNAVVLAPLPYPHAERLVTASIGARVWSTRMLAAMTASSTGFDALAGVHERAVTLTGDGLADVVRLEAVSTAYFELLGSGPAMGGLWAAAEDTPGAPPVTALMSESLWRRRYAGDPGIVGRSIVVDGTRLRVAGVLPGGFRGLIGRTDLWVPLYTANGLGVTTTPSDRPWSRWFEVIARVKAGVPSEQAQAVFEAEARRAVAGIPGSQAALGSRWRGTLVPLAEARRDSRVARASGVLLGGALFVLVLAATNLAGLHLVRTQGRMREFAIRAAIGARRADVAGVMVAESAIVVLAGALGGVALRGWFLDALMALRPEPASFGLRAVDLFAASALRLDLRSTAAIVGAAIACGAIVTALSLVRALRPALDTLLRGSVTTIGFSRFGRLRTGGALVALQLALGVMVAAGAGLMARTAAGLWSQDRAIDPRGVLTLRLHPSDARYPQPGLAALYSAVEHRLSAIPGVQGVSVSNCAPGGGRCRQTNVLSVDGRLLEPPHRPTVGVHHVTAGHFSVLGTPIVQGRAFDARDSAAAPRTVMINQRAAEQLWPGETAIGRRLALYFASGADMDEREVVGVVGNVRFDPIEDAPLPDVYVPSAQMAWTSTIVFVRGRDLDLPALAGVSTAVREIDPELAMTDVRSLTERLGTGFATERFLAVTLAGFAVAALVLAAIGVYGLASHAVAEGRRECAVRLALGAAPSRLFAFVAGRAAVLAAIGIVLGLAGAALSTRVLAGFLYGVQARDPATLAAAAAALALVTAAAVIVPARRAAALDPAELLRE